MLRFVPPSANSITELRISRQDTGRRRLYNLEYAAFFVDISCIVMENRAMRRDGKDATVWIAATWMRWHGCGGIRF
jgi:hypothetical protein